MNWSYIGLYLIPLIFWIVVAKKERESRYLGVAICPLINLVAMLFILIAYGIFSLIEWIEG